jgi:translation initiation factor eIF-2B subunit gamma
VGEGTSLGENTVVKRSVIGRNCKIGDTVKITNSVLMDNVVVRGEGVIIQGCILCSSTKINQRSEFKDCVIGYNQDIITTGLILTST